MAKNKGLLFFIPVVGPFIAANAYAKDILDAKTKANNSKAALEAATSEAEAQAALSASASADADLAKAELTKQEAIKYGGIGIIVLVIIALIVWFLIKRKRQ